MALLSALNPAPIALAQMPILNPSELELYLSSSSCTDLIDDEDKGTIAIRRAQLVAEGAIGANRRLELNTYTRILKLRRVAQSCMLPYFPIASVTSVSVRTGGVRSEFTGGQQPFTSWFAVDPNFYSVEAETGRVMFGILPGSSNGWFGGTGLFHGQVTEIKITYSSGFDFGAIPLSYEAEFLKSALAELISFQNSELGQGIDSHSFADIERISYVTGGRKESIEYPSILMMPFRRYRPRSSV